jgi:ABC-type branched-subunit amino acid transport system permease subunit
MEAYLGYFLYLLSLLTVGGIYAIFALGLNVQWGFAGCLTWALWVLRLLAPIPTHC